MELIRRFFALGCALSIAGCAQSGFGGSSGALGPGSQSVLPNAARSTAGPEIYVFQGSPDAYSPQSGVVNIGSTLYGTTSAGGANNLGAVYSVTIGGREKVLHSFTGGADGENPDAPLTNVNGTLYGTVYQGGKYHGTIFTIAPSGSYKIVYNFGTTTNDCFEPDSAMIYVPSEKALYGTAYTGGANGEGCIFKLSLAGNEPKESVVYSFTGSASSDTGASAPVFFKDAFYITTPAGGAHNYGAVLKVTLAGKESVVYSFKGEPDGANPYGGLVVLGEALYGTTHVGGMGPCIGYAGCGTVFEVTPAGKEKVLYRFIGSVSKIDGAGPVAPLIVVDGTLYGTAGCTGNGCGSSVIFSVNPTSKGRTIVYDFTDSSSSPPGFPISAFFGSLLSLDGKLYGTSMESAHTGDGTVWAVPR